MTALGQYLIPTFVWTIALKELQRDDGGFEAS